MDCPFCSILQDDPARVIKEGRNVLVFLSNPRLMPGHVLVAPKRHMEKPWELMPEERQELFDTVLEYQEKIVSTFSAGCDIREHYRPFIPQGRIKINHIHFHLHPRELDDELLQKAQFAEKALWQDLSQEERERMLKLFS